MDGPKEDAEKKRETVEGKVVQRRSRGHQPCYSKREHSDFVADTHDSTRFFFFSLSLSSLSLPFCLCVRRSANDGEPSRVERCHVVQSDARQLNGNAIARQKCMNHGETKSIL